MDDEKRMFEHFNYIIFLCVCVCSRYSRQCLALFLANNISNVNCFNRHLRMDTYQKHDQNNGKQIMENWTIKGDGQSDTSVDRLYLCVCACERER